MSIQGVDVSSYQKGWTPSKSDDFCFVKSVESNNYSNPERSAQLKTARNSGLVVGHYAFIHHGNIDSQISYFVKQTDVKDGELIVCDWEAEGCTNGDKDSWIKEIKKRYPKNKVGLYCNVDWWKNKDTSGYYGDFLWIAYYSSKQPPIATDWTFWQYTQTGTSSVGAIDRNVGDFSSRSALKTWAAGTKTTTTKTPTSVKETKPVFTISKSEAKVAFRGGWTCSCVADVVPFVEHRLKEAGLIKNSLDIYQLGWRTDVDASAGTHAKGGNIDIAQFSDACLKIERECGLGIQHRTKAQGFDEDHGHGMPLYCPHLSDAGNAQMQSYFNGRDGLRQNGPVTGPIVPIISWKDAIRKYNESVGSDGSAVEEDPVPTVFPTVKHSPKQKLSAGKAAFVKINAKGDLSFASGPGLIDALAQITVSGLPVGETVNLQVNVYDRYKDSKGVWVNKFVGSLAQNDVIGNSGRSNGQVSAHRKVGATKIAKASRVYRLRAFASKDCVIDSVSIDASATKV